ISRSDDRLPRRFVEEPSVSGAAVGHIAHAHEMLGEYYALRGWDETNGLPTPETLERLGLPNPIAEMDAASHG
ncbi:aldehyde ferredoxin oxidoreductase C-terminal domain-containing protein, partial [Candidatus Bipolaricaulota bacterium]